MIMKSCNIFLLFLISLLVCPIVDARRAATVQEMTESVKSGGSSQKYSWFKYGFYGLYGQDVANDDFQLNSRVMSFYTLGAYTGVNISSVSLGYLINYSINKQLQDSSRYGFTDLSGKILYSGIKLDFLTSKFNSIGVVYYLTSQYNLDNSFQNTTELNMSKENPSFSIQLNQKVYKSLGILFDYSILNHTVDDTSSAINNSTSENVRISIGISFFN